MERDGFRFEIVFVNDGSRDNTLAICSTAARVDRRLRIVNLSRNFGKEAALTAGIDHARGDVIVPMDIDLQDPPELIEPFMARWREGYDIVYGVRTQRAWDTAAKRLSASWFYRVFNSMSPVRIPENVGDFRLVDRRAVEVLRQLPERNRFMKGLFAWVGFNAIGVPYERPQRAAGSSKFNLWRLWNFALDGVVSFSTAPLARLVLCRRGDRRRRRALRPVHRHPRAAVRHRHAGLRLAVDRRAADGRHPAPVARHHRRISRPPLPRGQRPADLRGRGHLRERRRPAAASPDADPDEWTSRKKTSWAPISAGTGTTAPRRPRSPHGRRPASQAHPRRRRGLGLLLAPSAGRGRRAIGAVRRHRLRQRSRRQRRPASPCSTAATPARPTATWC